jgi:hypothetical protein
MCSAAPADTFGSIAVMNQYLANIDDQINGDMFVPTDVTQTSGILTMIFLGCENQSNLVLGYPGMAVTTNTPAFPIGYAESNALTTSCSLTPFVEPAATATTTSGWVLSFGDPAYASGTIELTIADTVSTRAFDFTSPYEIPVRPATLTAVFAGAIDGVARQTVADVGCECGWLLCPIP